MLNLLTVQDPLNDKLVTINVQVETDSKQRDGRTVLVSLSISGQVPVMLSGPFGTLDELIDQAWRQYGQRTSKASTTISEVKVQPTTKQSASPTKPKTPNPNSESILSLF